MHFSNSPLDNKTFQKLQVEHRPRLVHSEMPMCMTGGAGDVTNLGP